MLGPELVEGIVLKYILLHYFILCSIMFLITTLSYMANEAHTNLEKKTQDSYPL
jgi:hypothetical protein